MQFLTRLELFDWIAIAVGLVSGLACGYLGWFGCRLLLMMGDCE